MVAFSISFPETPLVARMPESIFPVHSPGYSAGTGSPAIRPNMPANNRLVR